MEVVVIEFHLDARSGLSPYQQLVQQVRHALRLGLLSEGDQLPKVKDVVATLAINPNTVLKAYRELDLDGLVEGRRGQGTFLASTPPPLEADRIDVLIDMVVRLVLSHVMQPTAQPAETAETIAWIADRVLSA